MTEDDDHGVGYGRPPKSTRFKPGQSGNPRGRPVGSRGLKAELKAELTKRYPVTVDGKKTRVSKLNAIVRKLSNAALNGDFKSIDKLLTLVQQVGGLEEERVADRRLSATDQLILDQFLDGGVPHVVSEAPMMIDDQLNDGDVGRTEGDDT